ncbi:MAG: hypothetical protein ACHQJ6_07480 [Candidatus Berkiellales bacterium]
MRLTEAQASIHSMFMRDVVVIIIATAGMIAMDIVIATVTVIVGAK